MVPNDTQICYFTIDPQAYSNNTTESSPSSPAFGLVITPVDPTNPLLAAREPAAISVLPSPVTNSSGTLLQMQTSVAHGHMAHRPRPNPIQNVLHITSNDSSSSSSASSISSTKSSFELARCSRCQRTPSTDPRTGKSNMVQYGLNLWYCNRCASMVGLKDR